VEEERADALEMAAQEAEEREAQEKGKKAGSQIINSRKF